MFREIFTDTEQCVLIHFLTQIDGLKRTHRHFRCNDSRLWYEEDADFVLSNFATVKLKVRWIRINLSRPTLIEKKFLLLCQNSGCYWPLCGKITCYLSVKRKFNSTIINNEIFSYHTVGSADCVRNYFENVCNAYEMFIVLEDWNEVFFFLTKFTHRNERSLFCPDTKVFLFNLKNNSFVWKNKYN